MLTRHGPRFLVAVLLGLAVGALGTPAAAQDGQLVVLTETGHAREGLPVYARHPDGPRICTLLSSGFSGRWLQLYRWLQVYLGRQGRVTPEPAYLVLSSTQGGFARVGFWLDEEDKRHAGYVDIHRSRPLTGRFGAVDQLLPHELAHVMLDQLLGGIPRGPSTQVHALGVRTDPITAFNEGLAECVQVLAIDDPVAAADTRALAADAWRRDLAVRRLSEYGRELAAPWRWLGRRRITFPFWFGGTEQVLRYHAVKANLFARVAAIPETLLEPADLYDAYLFQATQPGPSDGPARSAGVLLSTEAVVSHLLHRWVTTAAVGGRYREDAFYAAFGTSPSEVGTVENAFLKVFHAVATHRATDTAAMVRAYRTTYEDEAPLIDPIVREALLGQSLPDGPALWLANPDFRVGSSLYDQFRSAPRVHTFDLNAATMVDLLGVPGVDRKAAEEILGAAPYRRLAELGAVPRMSQEILARFERMAAAMAGLDRAAEESFFEDGLWPLLRPYVVRASSVLAVAAAAGAVFFHMLRRGRTRRGRGSIFVASAAGTVASLLVLLPGWLLEGAPPLALLCVPALAFGVPGGLWLLWRRRDPAAALALIVAWVAASLPATVVLLGS